MMVADRPPALAGYSHPNLGLQSGNAFELHQPRRIWLR